MRADALRAEAWAGEPFLRAEDDPEVVLAPGTARRRALDDALAEIKAKLKEPSSSWKVRYALLLGLERVLSEKPPHLASGTELRRHQVDALAGMLTELISAVQKSENGNGNGHAAEELADEEDELEDEFALTAEAEDDSEADFAPPAGAGAGPDDEEPLPVSEDPVSVRRYRFRHPTASGKT